MLVGSNFCIVMNWFICCVSMFVLLFEIGFGWVELNSLFGFFEFDDIIMSKI